ncbi:MAG: Jag N-terminal domain-containing protein [Desulfovibrio sp.]|jgi:spoIIIJ-associated protein|nr:Jag N-terminal domain-containing protein [Desulfovibrio sp.]
MTNYKEFQGKTLDEAILEACRYYGVPREKLEIEILNDAKTGIFGLVGAKKAEIRAARALLLQETVSALLEDGKKAQAPATTKEKQMSAPVAKAEAAEPGNAVPGGKRRVEKSSGAGEASSAETPACVETREQSQRLRPGAGEDSTVRGHAPLEAGAAEDMVEFDLAGADDKELVALVKSVVMRLAEPIVGQLDCRVEIADRRVRVCLECGDDAGLLVGREGQTMTALQYLAGRIVSRAVGGFVRLHVDADHYLERRDEKLRELALSLAGRVKSGGRPASTRPLNAYQRRIVHLALENDAEVLTRSKGDGMQRRVVIYPGRSQEKAGHHDLPPDIDGQDDDFGGPDPWNR